jgi:hypothetical protein
MGTSRSRDTPKSASVASAWLRSKLAFNKENPVDLVSQLVKVLEKASSEVEGDASDRLRSVSEQVRDVSRDVHQAWRRRTEV